MERQQYEQMAVGAGPLAMVAAISAGRLPRWLRIAFVTGTVAIAASVSVFAYRQYAAPITLTVATGSLDGESTRIMSAIAARLKSAKASVRLKVLDKGTSQDAARAFAAGSTNLAVVRGDAGNLPDARTIVVLTHSVVLIVALPGHSIGTIDDLKDKAVGVVGAAMNQPVIAAIAGEYEFDQTKMKITDVSLPQLPKLLKSGDLQALLTVTPISERYLSLLRSIVPRGTQAELIAIDAAAAIAAVHRSYESHDLPKGTIRGSPPIPKDDLTTLRVPIYLVANKNVDEGVVTMLTQAILDSRRDLVSEHPLLAQMASPGTDKDAYIPIHPGAAAYFDGDQKSFFDKYGDEIFYGSMLLGTVTSLLAAAWKFATRDDNDQITGPLHRLQALTASINDANSDSELERVEQQIDQILDLELKSSMNESESNAATTTLLVHRLEHQILQRKLALRLPKAGTSA